MRREEFPEFFELLEVYQRPMPAEEFPGPPTIDEQLSGRIEALAGIALASLEQ